MSEPMTLSRRFFLRKLTSEQRERVAALWQTGRYDTKDIAMEMFVPEASVYNILAAWREERRQ